MELPPPAFPVALSVEQRAAVLRDYSDRVLSAVIAVTSQAAKTDPIALRQALTEAGRADDLRILAEFHCGISWLVERVEALEAEVRAPRRKRWGGRA